MAFLDTAGLERLWQQIIAKLGTKADVSSLEGGDIIVAEAAHSASADSAATVTSMHGVTTAGTGAAYTATVDGIASLTAGASFIMIPHTNSTTVNPTLDVNGLGAKGIRMRGSAGTGTAMSALIAAWLTANRPVQVTYNGIFWLAEVTRPSASDLTGTVAIANGGTGATDAEGARTNIGAAAVQFVTWESGD